MTLPPSSAAGDSLPAIVDTIEIGAVNFLRIALQQFPPQHVKEFSNRFVEASGTSPSFFIFVHHLSSHF